MNYETIILEMLSRIQALEQQVASLQEKLGGGEAAQTEKVTTRDIQSYIEYLKQEAVENGEEFFQIKANDIHKALGLKSRFPMVCNAMRKCKRPGDEVVHETPSGYSSSLEIRYYLNSIQEGNMTYHELAEKFIGNSQDIPTVPKTNKRPKWFIPFEKEGLIYVRAGEAHGEDNSDIQGERVLNPAEFDQMRDIYLRRKAGESVSQEATDATRNQVYWFGIFAAAGM